MRNREVLVGIAGRPIAKFLSAEDNQRVCILVDDHLAVIIAGCRPERPEIFRLLQESLLVEAPIQTRRQLGHHVNCHVQVLRHEDRCPVSCQLGPPTPLKQRACQLGGGVDDRRALQHTDGTG